MGKESILRIQDLEKETSINQHKAKQTKKQTKQNKQTPPPKQSKTNK